MMGRAARDPGVPPVVELDRGESPSRLVRLLLKKYDAGSSRGPGKLDARLSPEEFAIPAAPSPRPTPTATGCSTPRNSAAYVAKALRDATVDVAFSPDGKGRASVRVRGGDRGRPRGSRSGSLPKGSSRSTSA